MLAHERKAHECVWKRGWDDSEECYYFTCPLTGETSWEDGGCPILRMRKKYLRKMESREAFVQCPRRCGKSIGNTVAAAKEHNKVCPHASIKCPKLGCGKRMMRKDLKSHLETSCEPAMRQAYMAVRAMQQREIIACPECKAFMKRRAMRLHLKERCPMRLVPCPYSDCPLMYSIAEFNEHCNTDCLHFQIWSMRIEEARKRQKKRGFPYTYLSFT